MIYITEYAASAHDASGARIAAGQEPSVADQVVATGGFLDYGSALTLAATETLTIDIGASGILQETITV